MPLTCVLLLLMLVGTTRLFKVVVGVKQSAKGRIVAYLADATARDDTTSNGIGEITSANSIRYVWDLERIIQVSIIDDIAKARSFSNAFVANLYGFPMARCIAVPSIHIMLRSKVGIAREGQRPAVKIGAIALGAARMGVPRRSFTSLADAQAAATAGRC